MGGWSRTNANCTNSHLKVYNGPRASATDLLGTYCGWRTPPTLHSSGSNLYFDFVLGEEDRGRFALAYVASDARIQVKIQLCKV